jgi:raffinose/stachyose/melibiose transport system substrate-binding protein
MARSTGSRGGRPLAFVASVIAMASLVACTGTPGQSGGDSAGASITWWGFAPTVKTTANDYIAAFNKAHPDIHVTFRQLTIDGYDAALRPALASPQGPDVYEIAPGGGIASIESFGRFAMDMKPVIEKSLGSNWQSKVAEPGISRLSTPDGKLTSLAIGSTYAGPIWINQNLFDDHHLTPPKTLPEWEHACAEFKKSGVKCLAHGAGQVAFNQDILQAIADSVKPGVWTKASKGEASWADPTIVQTLTIWKTMFHDGVIEPGALGIQHYPDANNEFLSGKAAMVMMGTWYMNLTTPSVMKDAISAAGVANPTPFTATAIPFPDVAGNGNPAALFGDPDWGLAVNDRSKNKEAAQTFASWLTATVEGQQMVTNTLQEIPTVKGVQPEWDKVTLVDKQVQQPMLDDLISKTVTSSEPRLSLVSAKLQQAIGVASQTVAAGKSTPEEAAATLQRTMQS